MAKKKEDTVKYIKSPTASGDLWLNDRKYDLKSDLNQKELQEIYEAGFTNLVVKV